MRELNIEDFRNKISNEKDISGKISAITLMYAAGANEGGSRAASRVIECIVGAALPMVGTLFNGGEPQDRFLFSLILAGACCNVSEDKDGFGVSLSVTPDNIREALDVFTRLTGKRIQPYLPKTMLDFAGQNSLH